MSIPIGLLLLCISMALAAGGLILVQRLVPISVRRQHNEVAGFIYAVLGVVYAVLLGLMVVAVWEEWNAAAVTADDEASSLAEIFWIAHRMPESDGPTSRNLPAPTPGPWWRKSGRSWSRRSRARGRVPCWTTSGPACRTSIHPSQGSGFSTNRAWSECATSLTPDETAC